MQTYRSLLMVIEKNLILDLESPARQLAEALPGAFVPTPTGLFLPNSLKPLVPGNVNLEDILTGAHQVCSRTLAFLKRKDVKVHKNVETHLSQVSFVSLFLSMHMARHLHHPNACSGNYEQSAARLLANGVDYNAISGKVEDCLSHELTCITQFIGYHTWNMYYPRVNDFTMNIERGVDWRILEYHRELEERERIAAETLGGY